jgi:hypothetical protein
MSTPSRETLIEALRARGLIAEDAAAPPLDDSHRPWFISLMLGVAGWLAGIFLLAFAVMMFELKTTNAFLALGLLSCGAAWALYFADRRGAFFDQLALALSIAGQCALAWAFLDDVGSALRISATLLALQLVVLLVMPNKTARTLAALFATIAWVYTVRCLIHPGDVDDLEHMLFGADLRHGHLGAGWISSIWLVTWVPLVLATHWLIRHENVWMADRIRVFARPILTGMLLALTLGGMATEPFIRLGFDVDGVGAPMSWASLFQLLSIALAMFAAWCAFQLRSSGLLGFAVFAALLHLSRVYYLYGTSLTAKSVIMLCLGAIMLGVAVLMQRRLETGSTT